MCVCVCVSPARNVCPDTLVSFLYEPWTKQARGIVAAKERGRFEARGTLANQAQACWICVITNEGRDGMRSAATRVLLSACLSVLRLCVRTYHQRPFGEVDHGENRSDGRSSGWRPFRATLATKITRSNYRWKDDTNLRRRSARREERERERVVAASE